MDTFYDRDFYGWAQAQAQLLRDGRLAEVDVVNLAEEIESMGRSEKRELANRLKILLLHLLKWQFQPERQGKSWSTTIRLQRMNIADHLSDNPSLKSLIPDVVTTAHGQAALAAALETGLDENIFPKTCPWNWDQIMDAEFWPEPGST